MISMSVRDEDILDVLWIETDLFHPADDQFLGVVGKDRVDENDPLARRQRPRRVNLTADEVEIVEDLRGLRVPGRARRRTGGVRYLARHGGSGVFAAALRQQTRSDEGAEELEPGRSLGRLDRSPDLRLKVPFDRSLLCDHAAGHESGNNGERCASRSLSRFHNTSTRTDAERQRHLLIVRYSAMAETGHGERSTFASATAISSSCSTCTRNGRRLRPS